MSKKLVALVMAAVLMLASFTACGKKAEEQTITLAFIGNTTGDYAQYGVPVRNSVAMYFEQLNAKGGINGKKVTLLEYDDKADGVEAQNAFNLAMEKKVVGIVGSVLTGATVALSDVTYEKNIPQITASATSPKVTVVDPDAATPEVKKNVFRSCFLDPFQGEKLAQFSAEECKAKKVAVFYETGSDYSEAIVSGFEKVMGNYGLEVVAKEAFATGDKDFTSQMTNIAAANPDVVIMPIYYGEAGLAITALRARGCKAQVLGGDGFGSVKDYASKEDLEGTIYFSGYAPGTESVAQFEKDYKAKYGEDVPNMFAPLAWDASMLMAYGVEAAEKSGKAYGSAEYEQAIIDAIKAANNVAGITGSYTFNETNDPVKSIALIKLSGGEEKFDRFY